METTLANSVNVLNPYTGEMNAKRHARDFLAQYGYMVENQTSFAVLRLTRTDVMILPSISLTVWVINSTYPCKPSVKPSLLVPIL
ncbi:AVB_G0016290.mRNA.1.CDS.1 [Saccharomyces cerevisiae]|nr:AVB_G0016290.mRNA.1.CDS.1 [Saccharomyces cerevisiae]CAI7106250.1 AVB_G0016290.mRNA.1.CDS.1 [Saccharomyces cerevisiae]